jgi:hypothetical protein
LSLRTVARIGLLLLLIVMTVAVDVGVVFERRYLEQQEVEVPLIRF